MRVITYLIRQEYDEYGLALQQKIISHMEGKQPYEVADFRAQILSPGYHYVAISVPMTREGLASFERYSRSRHLLWCCMQFIL